MLTNTNLEKFKVFYVVYTHRSILRAADALHVTRSAVSQSLKQLESELGVTFFLRDSKKFQPTSQADELFQVLQPFMNDLEATLKGFETGRKSMSGHLKIGAPLDFGSGSLTKVIGKFRKKFPDVSFELILAVPLKQLEMLTRGELDMAFIDNGDIHAEKFPVTVQSVAKEDFVMAASTKLYKEKNLKEATLENICRCPMVDYISHGPVTRLWLKHHFGRAHLEIAVVYSAESVRAVLTAIAADIGIGVVPRQLLQGEFSDLKVIATAKKPFVNEILLARSLGRKPSHREQEFIRFYKEHS